MGSEGLESTFPPIRKVLNRKALMVAVEAPENRGEARSTIKRRR